MKITFGGGVMINNLFVYPCTRDTHCVDKNCCWKDEDNNCKGCDNPECRKSLFKRAHKHKFVNDGKVYTKTGGELSGKRG